MKQLTFLMLALLIAACGSHEAAVESTTPTGNEGLGVVVTVFAEWQRGAQGNLDGQYDSQEGVFVPCGATQGVSIQPGEVKLLSGGSCDGVSKKLEPELLVVKRSGKDFNVVSREISVENATSEKGKGQYKTSAGVRQIEVDPATMNRIRAERIRLQTIHH